MKPLLVTTTLFLMSLFPLFASPLEVGADAPHLHVTLQTGEVIPLEGLYESGIVLVFFYPKADTPGCTAQACSLRDEFEVLVERGVTVLGVSGDSGEKQARFKEKHALPFDLVTDTRGDLMKAFGVPSVMGIAARQAFLIGDGRVVWRDTKASTSRQAEDVLAALDALEKQ